MKVKIVPIAGDASFRKFYRISLKKKKKIIVYTQKDKYRNLIIYIIINKFLRKNKILAPKLFSYNYPKGIIVIEDFGNVSFHRVLKKKNKLKNYKILIDLLTKIQKIKPVLKIKNFNNKTYLIEKYTNQHLHKETDLFFKWYLPMITNKKKAIIIKNKTRKVLDKLYKKLNFSNSYFVHRDYHAQNLMKVGKKVGLIDSQDALIGNPAYDLASLIDDVRIKTSKILKKKIYNYYLEKNSFFVKNKSKLFLEDFNILSVQRNLKIIGVFSRLFKRDQKNKYLKLIPHAWKLLEMRMESKIFIELKKIFDSNFSKKIRKKIVYK